MFQHRGIPGGDSSLDYRLHDSLRLKDQVVRQLERLRRALRDLQSNPEMLQASDSDTESEQEALDNEIQEMYSDLLDIVSGLFEISIMIQKPTSHNLLSANWSVVSSWRDHDRDFVPGRYPHAKAKIIDRLSSAISWRQALLTSREENFWKLDARRTLSGAYFASSKDIMRGFLCKQASSDVAGIESNTDETTALPYETHTEGFTLVLPPRPHSYYSKDQRRYIVYN